ncbi:acetate kinase [Cohaesibacter sp. ES.047]|uniref:acetate/propionate family kinase n=1 Tax=Cohaesibacter sp. ES.047 TaxID=1798205 RepID=UPI000BB89599|nr:acetate/propionate family kinase [Cohaesibacter sp. ES.047]SNY90105.1 acetate kinase [Cohaesibacter sp. ES.047]
MTKSALNKGALLVLNSGSSSVKFSLFELESDNITPLFAGQLTGIGTDAVLKAKSEAGELLAKESWAQYDKGSVPAILPNLLEWIEKNLPTELPLIGAGHRVVHGSVKYDKPVLIDGNVLNELASFSPLAPLHQLQNVAAIKALADSRPELRQVACFDTAFHHTMPKVSSTYAIPKRFTEAGVRRYGMHGLSYEYIAHNLCETKPDLAKGRVIVAHLGNGASLTALKDGVSIDTSMGFTALEGVPMGTRPGSIDPGILLYLMREYDMDADAIEKFLYHESGLLGVSGISNDMRDLEENTDPAAILAIDLFCSRVAKQIASLGVSIGGIDGLVFTAGIGEHGSIQRKKILDQLGWLGFEIDAAKNAANDHVISAEGSIPTFIIPTDEEFMIARHTVRLLNA